MVMKTEVIALLIASITATIILNSTQSVLSQSSTVDTQNNNNTASLSANTPSYYNSSNYNATDDYYNKYYYNTLIDTAGNETLQNANVSEWKIDLSNNGWTFVQSWKEVIGNTSNILLKYSDNGGKNYTQTYNVCPGGIDKRTGIYGQEFWVLCVVPTPSGHDNLFLVETRTGTTPFPTLTNISQNQTQEATILDFALNDITGGVAATWLETPNKINPDPIDPPLDNGDVTTYCFRC
jgi:hypothetical protein